MFATNENQIYHLQLPRRNQSSPVISQPQGNPWFALILGPLSFFQEWRKMLTGPGALPERRDENPRKGQSGEVFRGHHYGHLGVGFTSRWRTVFGGVVGRDSLEFATAGVCCDSLTNLPQLPKSMSVEIFILSVWSMASALLQPPACPASPPPSTSPLLCFLVLRLRNQT